jgi:hypothetical protein
MVVIIRDARILPSAQVRFKGRYTALMQNASAQIAGVISRAAIDGKVQTNRIDAVAGAAGDIVQRVFVVDGRTSIQADGVPISPYAKALFAEIYLVTVGIVDRHATFMQRYLDDETRRLLNQASRRIAEQGTGRLFEPNPLATYDPAHTWVDPRGYTLSQRIWNNGTITRQKLDGLISDLIRQGVGSQEIARRVERFLLPGRAPIRTNRPYGTDASYDAMRLARTEISRAHNQASWVAAYLNPYVDQIRLNRSPNGDPDCIICLEHAGPVGGEGIVYPMNTGTIPPFHPQCMCRVDAEVTRSPQSVTDELRGMLQDAERELIPMLTPVQRDAFVEMLLGQAVATVIRQLLPMQLLLGL